MTLAVTASVGGWLRRGRKDSRTEQRCEERSKKHNSGRKDSRTEQRCEEQNKKHNSGRKDSRTEQRCEEQSKKHRSGRKDRRTEHSNEGRSKKNRSTEKWETYKGSRLHHVMINVSCTFNWNGWKSKPRNSLFGVRKR